ncbi:MAG: ABC transporter permease [Anaerolineales bacterium]|nr:ABC transporter permease [Anaerolineales bacterium]
MRVLPGDPASLLLGFEAKPDDIAIVRHNLGLDRSVIVQFSFYVRDIFTGKWGNSILTSRPVMNEAIPALANTLQLVAITIFISTLLGILIGFLTANSPYTIFDSLVMLGTMLGLCTPSFVWAIFFVAIFSVNLRWLPAVGIGGIRHLVLPCLTLIIGTTTIIARTSRSAILEVLNADYIRTARGKGLNESRVIYKHALPNALVPIVTIIGLQINYMVGGVALVEMVFAYPGIGWLMVESINSRDYPIVQACALIIAFLTIFNNLFVDILYQFLDPRVKLAD